MSENNIQTNEENIDDKQASAGTENAETKQVDTKVPYDRFKAKVDEANALKEELARLREAKEAEERKQLEEQNEFKALYEQAQEQLAQIKADALNAKKDALLTRAGYTSDQIKVLRNTVAGETDEEITQSIEDLKTVISPKPNYVDPSPMNGLRDKPEQKDGEEIGKSLFERLKAKGKIR